MPNRLNPSSIPDVAHCVSTGAYMRLVIEEWLLDRGWLPALPVAGAIMAAWITGDSRLWVVVPVLICLILPLVLAFVYYAYSLTPEAAAAIRPHLTRVDPDGSLTLIPVADAESDVRLPVLHVGADEIKSVEERSSQRIVRLHGKPFRFIIIPQIQ